jgi:hypothetical protein
VTRLLLIFFALLLLSCATPSRPEPRGVEPVDLSHARQIDNDALNAKDAYFTWAAAQTTTTDFVFAFFVIFTMCGLFAIVAGLLLLLCGHDDEEYVQ